MLFAVSANLSEIGVLFVGSANKPAFGVRASRESSNETVGCMVRGIREPVGNWPVVRGVRERPAVRGSREPRII